MNKQTFYCGTCKATKNKQSPLFLVKFNQKKIPKNLPKSETLHYSAKKYANVLFRHLLRFYELGSGCRTSKQASKQTNKQTNKTNKQTNKQTKNFSVH
jgi:hypothetical protein